MMMTNLIFSSILAFQSIEMSEYYSKAEIKYFQYSTPANSMFSQDYTRSQILFSSSQEQKILSFVQTADLIYKDIYEYTKPNLNRHFSYKGASATATEQNPIADMFFKNNLWDLAFISANFFNYLIYSNDDFFLPYSILLTASELLAISTWSIVQPIEVNAQASVFVYTF